MFGQRVGFVRVNAFIRNLRERGGAEFLFLQRLRRGCEKEPQEVLMFFELN